MKTGSTAIQDSLRQYHVDILNQGISSHHVLAKNLFQNLDNILKTERTLSSPFVLLSSEFFGQMNPMRLGEILSQFRGSKHALFVRRPFREIYPSLYLQNLKGSSRRITSFRNFLENQLLLDYDPGCGRTGQVMNAPILNARLVEAGCTTHWISYSRDHLMERFFEVLEFITGRSLTLMNKPPLPRPNGLSSRRSLRMELAVIARLINLLNRRGILSGSAREGFLMNLLDWSEKIKQLRPDSEILSKGQRRRCDDLDYLVNHQFLAHRGLLDF